jgi:hypothetical protein
MAFNPSILLFFSVYYFIFPRLFIILIYKAHYTLILKIIYCNLMKNNLVYYLHYSYKYLMLILLIYHELYLNVSLNHKFMLNIRL